VYGQRKMHGVGGGIVLHPPKVRLLRNTWGWTEHQWYCQTVMIGHISTGQERVCHECLPESRSRAMHHRTL
jgi:hypothetical protein